MLNREKRLEVVNCLYQFDLLNKEIDKSFLNINSICEEIINNLNVIDSIIENSLENYTLNRLSYVDRAIIRLATYEMKFTDRAHPIIINEAIELTKELSDIDDKQFKFNNKLLDNIKKRI